MNHHEAIAYENIVLMLRQQLRGARALAKVESDPIAKAEAKLLASLLETVAPGASVLPRRR